jgi:hypothetical protein
MLFKNPDLVQELNENYKRVLLNEFDMNKRSHAFIEEIVDVNFILFWGGSLLKRKNQALF